MPTPDEIYKGVFDNAKLEVAKKLKVLLIEKLAQDKTIAESIKKKLLADLTSADYLKMAEDAIKKREVTIEKPGIPKTTINLKELGDQLKATAEGREKIDKMGGTPDELVPTEDQLKKVAAVTSQSIKKATGPITVMGTSLFTLITAFFQTVGDLFSGKIGFGDFFKQLKKNATEQTSTNIGNNLRSGLTALTKQDENIAKWLDIESTVTGVEHEARIRGGLDKRDPKTDEQKLDEITPEKVMADMAKKKIRDSVEKDVLGIVSSSVGIDVRSGGAWDWIKQQAGFKATNESAERITDKITDAVTKVMTDPTYRYKDKEVSALTKEELKEALKIETKKALEEYKNSAGRLSFSPSESQINDIANKMEGYVDKNYDMLKDLGAQSRVTTTAPAAPLPPLSRTTPIPGKLKADVETMLRSGFDAKIKNALVETLNKELAKKGKPPITDPDKDPFIIAAREKFVAIGADEIGAAINSNNPQYLKDTAGLSSRIVGRMMQDEDLKKVTIPILKDIGLVSPTATPADTQAGLEMFGAQVETGITKFLNDADIARQLNDLATSVTPGPGPSPSPMPGPPPVAPAPPAISTAAAGLALKTALEKQLEETPGAKDMLDTLTGLDKEPDLTKRQLDRIAKLDAIAKTVASSGAIVTRENPNGLFTLDIGKQTISFAKPISGNDAEKENQTKERFTQAKQMIADNLRKDQAATGIVDEDKINAIAEKTALEMVNQSLKAQNEPAIDLSLDANKAFYLKEQTKAAETLLKEQLASEIKNLPAATKELVNLAALTMGVDKVLDTSAKTLAPLLAAGEKDIGKLTKALDDALKTDIPDAMVRGQVVGIIGSGVAKKMGVAAAPAPGPTTATTPATAAPAPTTPAPSNVDIAKSLAQAKALAKLTVEAEVGKALDGLTEDVKKHVKKVPVFFAPEKLPKWAQGRATEWVKKKWNGSVNAGINGAVDAMAATVNKEKLKELVNEAVLAVAQKDFGGGKQFWQLSEEEKKSALAEEVKTRLATGDNFNEVFMIGKRGKIDIEFGSINLGVAKIHIPGIHTDVPAFIKNKVINEVGKGIENGLKLGGPMPPSTSMAALPTKQRGLQPGLGQ